MEFAPKPNCSISDALVSIQAPTELEGNSLGVTLGDQACPKELAEVATRLGEGLERCKATLLFVNIIVQFCNRNWLAKIAQHHLKRRRTKYGTEQKTVLEHWAPSIYI